MNGETRLERRIRVSGALVGTGLLVELATLFSSSPTAFLLFALLGGTLILGGSLWFLAGLAGR